MIRCRNSRLMPALTTFVLVMATGPVAANIAFAADPPGIDAGAPPAEPTRVISLRRGHAYQFVFEGDSFRRVGRIDATSLQLPSPVLREARGTYVQIHTKDGPVWLERMQLVLDRTKQVTADCPSWMSSVGDRTIAGTSGAGEGC